MKCYDKVIELRPNDARAWYNKGAVLGNLGKHEEAFKYFDKAVEIDPNFKAAQEARERARKKIPEKKSESKKKWQWYFKWGEW